MAPSDIVIDQWSPLAHKPIVGQPGDPPDRRWLAPTWVPATERRRLAAYQARAAYLEQVARLLLPRSMDAAERDGWREYGDPGLLVRRVAAAVLGDHPAIAAVGADTDLLAGPLLPDPPEPPPAPGVDLVADRIHATRLRLWASEVDRVIGDWEAAVNEQPGARAAQTVLRAWADRVQLDARLAEATGTAVGLGDAVIVLWPRPGRMPTVTVHDGDAYFPTLSDDASEPFPPVVHLAWEEQVTDPQGRAETWVRRLTWQLVPITHLHTDPTGTAWLDRDGRPAATPTLAATDTVTSDGQIARHLPWHGPDDEPATVTCLHSDGMWRLADVQAGKVDALNDDRAVWHTPPVDLGIDFLPVIHLPGSPEGAAAHYGRSIIDGPAQLLDDIAANDGNVASASAYLADPTIALSGARAPESGAIAPGRIYGLGENGSMSVLDLSAGLTGLHATGDRLLDRLSETTGVPAEVLGRASADAATSGVHLLLRLAPWAQLIAHIRLGITPKLRLLPRMAHRLGQVAGVIDSGPTPDVSIRLGAFLPSDQAGAVATVAAALTAHTISVETAVSMLVSAGLPIPDATVEVARIVAQDTQALNALADALAGAPDLAGIIAARAGIDLTPPPAPTVVLPG